MIFEDLAQASYIKNGLLGIGEPLPGEMGNYALQEANRMLDSWNIQQSFIWSQSILTFNLTARTLPQYWFTIGPTGGTLAPDFAVTSMPTKITRANLILTSSTPTVRVPIEIHDARQWSDETVPGLGTVPIPNKLYYDYGNVPNGVATNINPLGIPVALSNIYAWPYPTATGNQIELFVPNQAMSRFVTVADTFSMPLGYEDAFMLTLSERLCEGIKDIPPTLAAAAAFARANVKSVNSKAPKISTTDSGMPGRTKSSGNFYNGFPTQLP